MTSVILWTDTKERGPQFSCSEIASMVGKVEQSQRHGRIMKCCEGYLKELGWNFLWVVLYIFMVILDSVQTLSDR